MVDRPAQARVSSLAAFRYPAFRVFWNGHFIRWIGTWMALTTNGWLILELTDSPAFLGLNAGFQAVPVIVFSFAGGLIAERFDRYRVMISQQVAQLTLDVVLAGLVATGAVQVWHIFIYSFLSATSRGLNTPAREALVPGLVPKQALLSAIALNALSWPGAMVLAPPIAGWLIAGWGIEANYFANVAAQLVNLVALLCMPALATAEPAAASRAQVTLSWRSLAEGVRYARDEPRLRPLLLAVAGTNFFGRSYHELMPVFARDVLEVGPRGLGLLLAMPALGTVLAGFALAATSLVAHKGRWLLASTAILAVALLAFAVSTSFPLSLAALLVVGSASTAGQTLASTLLLQTTPDSFRGRVMGFHMAASQGNAFLGSLPGGLAAAVWGAPLAVALSATLILALAAALATRAVELRRL